VVALRGQRRPRDRIDHYGASGKAPELYKKFGITAEHVLQEIMASIKGTMS